MEKKNTSSKKGTEEKTMLTKIAGKVGYLAGEIVAGKDHLIEMAGDAMESMKTAVKNITAKKKAPKKRAPKPTAKKTVKPAVAVAKKAVKKIAKKAPTPAKKAAKKVAKKAAPKK
ncbi:MAG: hypothetical protein ABIN67_08015 [Ferruginibacter sp.]